MPRGFPNARNEKDIRLLLSLVSQNIQDVKCTGRSGAIRQRKNNAWISIEKDFNSSEERSRRATRHELQLLWNNLKSKTRRHRKSIGPSAPLSDPITAQVERLLQKIGEAPASSEDSSADSDSGHETPARGANTSEAMTPRSSSVDYCPRREFLPLAPDAAGAQGNKLLRPLVSDGQRSAFTPCPSPSRSYQVVGQPFGQSQNTFRPIVPLPPLQPRPAGVPPSNGFFPVGPRNFAVYVPPVSALAPPATVSRAPFTTVRQQQPLSSPPAAAQPSLAIDNPRAGAQSLQDAETLVRIRHMQALTSMEKALQENKMRVEEMLTAWAKEQQDARMRSDAASREGSAEVHKMLMKREEELHLAKMRVEEINFSNQKELHDLRMETAKIEQQLAEINKRIFERKLEQVEMELQYTKNNGIARNEI